MDAFNIFIGLITLVGAWFTYRDHKLNRSAHVLGRQAEMQSQLKGRLRSQGRLARAVNRLEHGVPSSLVNADLEELRDYLRGRKNQFLAPTLAQFDALIKSIDDALAALDQAQHTPLNDTAFLKHVEEIKCNQLRPALTAALTGINSMLNGLVEIEKKPMSLRKQRTCFLGLALSTSRPSA